MSKSPRPQATTKPTPSCSVEHPCGKCASCRSVLFFEKLFTHAKGELGGRPFTLQLWQQNYVRALFAERDNKRIVRTSLLALPRKNGKSSLCAGIALRLLLARHRQCHAANRHSAGATDGRPAKG